MLMLCDHCSGPPNYLSNQPRRTLLTVVLCCGLLAACDPGPLPPQATPERHCFTLSGSAPVELVLGTRVAELGAIEVSENGISALASADGKLWSASPVARTGRIVFAPEQKRAAGPGRVVVRSNDSKEIEGTVCVTVHAVAPFQSKRAQADRLFAQAGVQTAQRNWRRSFELYARAARLYSAAREPLWSSHASHALAALAYLEFSDNRLAEVLASTALSTGGSELTQTDKAALAELVAKGRMDVADNDARHGRAQLLELLAQVQRLGQGTLFGRREEPRLDILRGFIEYSADNLNAAAALFVRAAERCERLMDWECYARARQNHALLAEGSEDYPTALAEYHAALTKLDPALEPHLAADIWDNLGALQGLLALSRLGESSYLSALRLYASVQDCDGVRRTLSRLGTLTIEIGNPGDAEYLLRAAASHSCASLMSTATEGASLAQLSDALSDAATVDQTEACAAPRAAATLSEEGKYAVFVALLYLGNSASQSNLPTAARCFAAARFYITDIYASLRYDESLAVHFERQGATGSATQLYRRMLETADKAQLSRLNEKRSAAALGLARDAVLEHRPHDALRHLRSVVGALSERGDARQLIQALRVYADAERDLQHDGAAAAALRGAAAFVEAVPISALDGDKRAAFVATQHEVYSEWTDLLASAALKDPTQTWAAFEVSERGRARSLRLALAQSPDSTSNRGPADGEAAYHELIAGVGQRARASDYAARWPEALLAQIESARAGSNDREPGAGVTLPAALSDLDATLVEYAVGNERLFAFVADARSIRVFPLGPLGPVREGAAALLKALREPEGTERTIGPAARRLAELIWWPIEPALTRPKIVLVPDDTLYTVPFAVLPWSARAASELTLARAELTSLGSASLLPAVSRLAMGSARHAQRGRFELFGDPVTSPDDWERRCGGAAAARAGHGASAAAALPGSRREVITVSTLARQANPSRPIDVHLSCEATHSVLDRAIGRDPALLHIATHGAVDGARPRLSALMMSQTRAPENSDFSVVDILRHRITTRLVVLSACETSAGQMLPGEGLLGPAQAFLHAGASSVIGSAWKVPDEHTAEFMARFYELLLTKGLRASAALRAAQLEERTRTQSYAWAAFGIFGSPEVRFEPE